LAAFEDYLKQTDEKPKFTYSIIQNIGSFLDWYGKPATDVSVDDVNKFLDMLLEQGFFTSDQSTIAGVGLSLERFFEFVAQILGQTERLNPASLDNRQISPSLGKGKRILLIGFDDDIVFSVIEPFYGLYGFTIVSSVRNSINLTELCKQHTPDFIFIFVSSHTGYNFFDLCREAKENPDTKEIILIGFTAMTDYGRGLDRDWSWWPDDFLSMPFDIEDLLRRLEKFVFYRR
jgi:hypothetical protein